MPATKAALDVTKLVLGKCAVFIGDFGTASGLDGLGIVEGTVSARIESQFSTLKLPELAGEAPIAARHMGDTIVVDIPLIVGDPALWASVSPRGAANGGSTTPADVTTTSLVLIPENQLASDGTISYATTTWTPAEPTNALFIPKGYFTHPAREYEFNGDGSKKVTPVQFVGMLDTSMPAGFQLWFQGAAAAIAAGVTIAI